MHKEKKETVFFGFWLYLMTDLLMFAILFATYAVLRDSTFGSITIKEIFNPPFVLFETVILLLSSFTSGLAVLYARNNNLSKTISFFIATVLLGIVFLGMEISEFTHLFETGNSFQRSAFLSAFFALIGFHGLHITAGVFWITLMIVQFVRRGLTEGNVRKAALAGIFWHFLDLVWIFIFTIVYLFGGLI